MMGSPHERQGFDMTEIQANEASFAPRPKASTTSSLCSIVDAILEVGRQRAAVLVRLRAALQSGKQEEALDLARELCGMEYEKKSHRTSTRLN
jgi:hypothetical protein